MKFIDRLARSQPGDEIVYHVGFHLMGANLGKMEDARDAYDAYLRGDVLLYQRRIAKDRLEYCAKVLA